MVSYYIDRNTRATGHREVHRWGCGNMPRVQNRYYLGEHDTAESAIQKAERSFSWVEGGALCSRQRQTP